MISPDIHPLDEFGTWGIECDKLDTLNNELEFHFVTEDGQPVMLTVPPEEFYVGRFDEDPTYCQTYINSLEDIYVVGGSLLKSYYTVWDMNVDQPKIGFALNVS